MSDLDDAVHAVQEKILDIVVPILDRGEEHDVHIVMSAMCGLTAMFAAGEGFSRKFLLKRMAELYDQYERITNVTEH
jgi:hypothetical protein